MVILGTTNLGNLEETIRFPRVNQQHRISTAHLLAEVFREAQFTALAEALESDDHDELIADVVTAVEGSSSPDELASALERIEAPILAKAIVHDVMLGLGEGQGSFTETVRNLFAGESRQLLTQKLERALAGHGGQQLFDGGHFASCDVRTLENEILTAKNLRGLVTGVESVAIVLLNDSESWRRGVRERSLEGRLESLKDICESSPEKELKVALGLASQQIEEWGSNSNNIDELLELFDEATPAPSGFYSGVVDLLRKGGNGPESRVVNAAIVAQAWTDVHQIGSGSNGIGLLIESINSQSFQEGCQSLLKGLTDPLRQDFANEVVHKQKCSKNLIAILGILPSDVTKNLSSTATNSIRHVINLDEVPREQLKDVPRRVRILEGHEELLARVLTPRDSRLGPASLDLREFRQRLGTIVGALRTLDTQTNNDSQDFARRVRGYSDNLQGFANLPPTWQQFILEHCEGGSRQEAAERLGESISLIVEDQKRYGEQTINEELKPIRQASRVTNDALLGLGNGGFVVCFQGDKILLCQAFRETSRNTGETRANDAAPPVLDQNFLAVPDAGTDGTFSIYRRPPQLEGAPLE